MGKQELGKNGEKQSGRQKLKRDGRWQLGKRRMETTEHQLFDLNVREKVLVWLSGMVLCVLLAITFFKAFWGVVLTIPVLFFYVKYAAEKFRQKKIHQLRVQFKDSILTLASSLRTGYSLNHAFEETLEISAVVYGSESMIVSLLERVVHGQNLNISMDRLLEEMAERSQLEEVREFTEVVKIVRRYGGNLPTMIQKLADVMEDRLSVQAEILSATTSVRYEAYMMDIIPVAIIWYMNLTGPSFLAVLYSSLAGRVFMGICMFLYLAVVIWQFWLMERVVE